jgi:hypothetical protein
MARKESYARRYFQFRHGYGLPWSLDRSRRPWFGRRHIPERRPPLCRPRDRKEIRPWTDWPSWRGSTCLVEARPQHARIEVLLGQLADRYPRRKAVAHDRFRNRRGVDSALSCCRVDRVMTIKFANPRRREATMTHARSIPLVRPINVDGQGARHAGLVPKLVAAALSLFRRDATAARDRAVGRISMHRSDVGFPCRTTPNPSPTKRDHNCDCVPLWW